jgi:hypothetical protein
MGNFSKANIEFEKRKVPRNKYDLCIFNLNNKKVEL